MTEIIPLPNGVELGHQQLKLRIEAWGPNSLRLRVTLIEERAVEAPSEKIPYFYRE